MGFAIESYFFSEKVDVTYWFISIDSIFGVCLLYPVYFRLSQMARSSSVFHVDEEEFFDEDDDSFYIDDNIETFESIDALLAAAAQTNPGVTEGGGLLDALQTTASNATDQPDEYAQFFKSLRQRLTVSDDEQPTGGSNGPPFTSPVKREVASPSSPSVPRSVRHSTQLPFISAPRRLPASGRALSFDESKGSPLNRGNRLKSVVRGMIVVREMHDMSASVQKQMINLRDLILHLEEAITKRDKETCQTLFGSLAVSCSKHRSLAVKAATGTTETEITLHQDDGSTAFQRHRTLAPTDMAKCQLATPSATELAVRALETFSSSPSVNGTSTNNVDVNKDVLTLACSLLLLLVHTSVRLHESLFDRLIDVCTQWLMPSMSSVVLPAFIDVVADACVFHPHQAGQSRIAAVMLTPIALSTLLRGPQTSSTASLTEAGIIMQAGATTDVGESSPSAQGNGPQLTRRRSLVLLGLSPQVQQYQAAIWSGVLRLVSACCRDEVLFSGIESDATTTFLPSFSLQGAWDVLSSLFSPLVLRTMSASRRAECALQLHRLVDSLCEIQQTHHSVALCLAPCHAVFMLSVFTFLGDIEPFTRSAAVAIIESLRTSFSSSSAWMEWVETVFTIAARSFQTSSLVRTTAGGEGSGDVPNRSFANGSVLIPIVLSGDPKDEDRDKLCASHWLSVPSDPQHCQHVMTYLRAGGAFERSFAFVECVGVSITSIVPALLKAVNAGSEGIVEEGRRTLLVSPLWRAAFERLVAVLHRHVTCTLVGNRQASRLSNASDTAASVEGAPLLVASYSSTAVGKDAASVPRPLDPSSLSAMPSVSRSERRVIVRDHEPERPPPKATMSAAASTISLFCTNDAGHQGGPRSSLSPSRSSAGLSDAEAASLLAAVTEQVGMAALVTEARSTAFPIINVAPGLPLLPLLTDLCLRVLEYVLGESTDQLLSSTSTGRRDSMSEALSTADVAAIHLLALARTQVGGPSSHHALLHLLYSQATQSDRKSFVARLVHVIQHQCVPAQTNGEPRVSRLALLVETSWKIITAAVVGIPQDAIPKPSSENDDGIVSAVRTTCQLESFSALEGLCSQAAFSLLPSSTGEAADFVWYYLTACHRGWLSLTGNVSVVESSTKIEATHRQEALRRLLTTTSNTAVLGVESVLSSLGDDLLLLSQQEESRVLIADVNGHASPLTISTGQQSNRAGAVVRKAHQVMRFTELAMLVMASLRASEGEGRGSGSLLPQCQLLAAHATTFVCRLVTHAHSIPPTTCNILRTITSILRFISFMSGEVLFSETCRAALLRALGQALAHRQRRIVHSTSMEEGRTRELALLDHSLRCATTDDGSNSPRLINGDGYPIDEHDEAACFLAALSELMYSLSTPRSTIAVTPDATDRRTDAASFLVMALAGGNKVNPVGDAATANDGISSEGLRSICVASLDRLRRLPLLKTRADGVSSDLFILARVMIWSCERALMAAPVGTASDLSEIAQKVLFWTAAAAHAMDALTDAVVVRDASSHEVAPTQPVNSRLRRAKSSETQIAVPPRERLDSSTQTQCATPTTQATIGATPAFLASQASQWILQMMVTVQTRLIETTDVWTRSAVSMQPSTMPFTERRQEDSVANRCFDHPSASPADRHYLDLARLECDKAKDALQKALLDAYQLKSARADGDYERDQRRHYQQAYQDLSTQLANSKRHEQTIASVKDDTRAFAAQRRVRDLEREISRLQASVIDITIDRAAVSKQARIQVLALDHAKAQFDWLQARCDRLEMAAMREKERGSSTVKRAQRHQEHLTAAAAVEIERLRLELARTQLAVQRHVNYDTSNCNNETAAAPAGAAAVSTQRGFRSKAPSCETNASSPSAAHQTTKHHTRPNSALSC